MPCVSYHPEGRYDVFDLQVSREERREVMIYTLKARNGEIRFYPSPSGKTVLVVYAPDGRDGREKRLRKDKAKALYKSLLQKRYTPVQ